MLNRITELELNKEYSFDVVYREGSTGYAATLKLTPGLITFKVMSERNIALTWDAKEARCQAGNQKFYLKGLVCTSTRASSISHLPPVSFYEIEFHAESVIFCPEGGPYDGRFQQLNIFSDTVTQWIGYTTTQDKISEENSRSGDVSPHLVEFMVDVNDREVFGVEYNGIYTNSPSSFEQTFTFPPSLFYTLDIQEHALNPYKLFVKISNLIHFLSGIEPSVQKVTLDYDLSGYSRSASLYFVQTNHARRKNRPIVFPLGKDLRFQHVDLPSFPLSSFSLYFSQGSELPDLLQKYVLYRHMRNAEDRLLGYFRLLEKHCYSKKSYLSDDQFVRFSRLARNWAKSNGLSSKEVKSFDGGLKRFNGTKYNTEKCLTDFYKSLPLLVQRELGMGLNDIGEACTLRNNITHANKYDRNEFRLGLIQHYIHCLLVFAILEKLEVPLEELTALPDRIYSY